MTQAKYRQKKRANHFNAFDGTVFVLLTLYSIGLLLLIFWAMFSSFKTADSYLRNPTIFFGNNAFTFDNYIYVFSKMRVRVSRGSSHYVYFEQMLLYSARYAGGCAFIQTAVTTTVTYLTSKYPCLLSKIVHYSVIVTMVLPIVGNMSSMIQVLRALHIYDTMIGMYIMKFGYANLYYLIFYAAFSRIPKDYTEYALVEGASHFRIYTRVMLPIVMPLFGTVALLLFINYWNDYQVPYVYLPNSPTAALGLYAILNVNTEINEAPFKIAAGVLLFIPLLILFLIFRNKIMSNMDEGGIKG